MKKRWYAGILWMTAVLGISGCGKEEKVSVEEPVSTETEQVLEELFFSAAEDEIENVMMEEYSESTEYPELAAFLAAHYQIPEEYLQETRYYYNYLDLNEDGTDEIVALTIGETTSSSEGECVLVLSKNEESFDILGDFRNARTPVIVSDEMINGWHELIYQVYGGGQDMGYVRHTYREDTGYQSGEEDFMEETEGILGIKVLSNNLIDDMDKGNYLTLVPREEEN